MYKPYNKLRHFEEIEKVPAKVYYHYTSLDALFSIVSSRTFRLTSLRSSNDKKEFSYNIERFLTDFSQIIENEQDDNTKRCFQRLQKSVEENEQTFKREIGGKHTPYALCLSKKRDNLTHWDRYAANCTGVCIGVNIAALNVLYNRTENYIYGSSLFDIGRTLYTQKTLQEYIRNSTIRLISMLTDASKKAPDTDIGKMIDKLGFVYMAVVFQNIIKFVKNSSFIDEDELRLYYENESISATLKLIKSMAPELDKTVDIDFESSFNKLVEMLEIKEEHFAMSKSGIRSYHNLCLDEVWGSGVIPEIILGPMCVQNRTEFDRFLRSNGLGDTKVSVSKVPIR